MKNFKMNSEEQLIHQIINDTRVHDDLLEVSDIVREIATINWVKQALEIDGIDFIHALSSYRSNLLKHIEEL